MRLTSLLFPLRLTIVASLIVAPVLFAAYQQKQMKNFRVVQRGVLYRSGQMTLPGLKRAIHDHGIRTVISLRDARLVGEEAPDAAEADFCREKGIRHIRITPRPWEGAPGQAAPVDVGVSKFVEVMSDSSNYPVLLHCFAGTHRTGAYCAVYRMEFDGWSNEKAIAELKETGYSHVEDEKDIFGYLSNYRPRRSR